MKTVTALKQYWRVLSGFCIVMLLASCAAVVAGGALGAGAVVYEKGELDQNLGHPVPAVYDATMATLRDFKMPVLEDRHDALSAKVKSKLSSGEDVKINISSITASSSKIGIRVGLAGDKDKSRTILDRIDEHLK